MTNKLGIIGFPIGHSISPRFQQAALDHCGIDATYEAWEITPDWLSEFMQGLRDPVVLGINVTVPHKEAVIPYVDEVDDLASTSGAVNTIVNRGGRLTGHNTDGAGFLRALREVNGFTPQGRRALVLGAGGAARGVVLALIREGVAHLTIANRTLSKAERLTQMARETGTSCLAIPLDGHTLSGEAASADLIVNCTTLGMAHGPDDTATPLGPEHIPSTALVNDLVYNPLESPLLRAAAQAGARVLGGIHMLVYQGAASFEMWTSRPAPVPVMLEAATRGLAER